MKTAGGASLAAAALLLCSCVHHKPRHSPVPAAQGARLEVPFFSDDTDQCGPSALASVLGFWGAAVGPESLKTAIYTPRLKGSLAIDLLLAARGRGMRAEMIEGGFERLKAELDAGRPVIAFVNRGFRSYPIGHFMVITGYDEGRQALLAHSGKKRAALFSYRKFSRDWEKTGRWALLVRGPDGPEGWVAFGNAAFEEGRLEEAEFAFRTALGGAPFHAGAANNLAMTLLARRGDLREAANLAAGALSRAGSLRPYILDTLAQIEAATGGETAR